MVASKRVRIAIAIAALSGTTLVACNLISGLSDREVCEGAECPPTTPTTSSSPGDDPDSSPPPPPPVPLPEGATPSDWAKWPMREPDASTYGPRIDQNGVFAIVDPTTKITWQAESGGIAEDKIGGSKPMSAFEVAKAYCAGLSTADKWRVPTRIELVSLFDTSVDQVNLTGPARDRFAFSDDAYISSTPAPLQPDAGRYEFYIVKLTDELQVNITAGGSYRVRCVLGDP